MLVSLCLIAFIQDVPSGFTAVDLAVFEHSAGIAPHFHVENMAGNLRIETLRAWQARIDEEQEHAVKGRGAMTFYFDGHRARWWPGLGTRVDDGWLVGYDRGEFGGGLLWFSKDGKRRQSISGDNTQAIGKSKDGVFAFQSLEHLGALFYSHVIELRRSGAAWETRTVSEYRFAPSAVAFGASGFVYAKSDAVGLLGLFGTSKEIYRNVSARFAPNSIAFLPNGDLWVGCAYGLLRLRPKSEAEYSPAWFLHKG